MLDKLETIRMAKSMTAHAAQRAALVAGNVANADTPGYRARDIRPFEDSYDSGGRMALRTTRVGHGDSTWHTGEARTFESRSNASPNGNSVSVEDEMFNAADARREHELSLAVYNASLTMMRTAIGRRG